MIETVKKIFKKYFITGLLVLGPLLISAWIVQLIVTSADNMLQTQHWITMKIPGLGILATVLIIIVVGFLTRNLLGQYIIDLMGSILTKIPVLGTIYSSTKQLFETLLTDKSSHFDRVVLIPYPHANTQALAFVTSENVPEKIQKIAKEPLLSVFVPTTPNPTSGFYLYVPKSQALETHLKVEEAFKIIVSLGLVDPEQQR